MTKEGKEKMVVERAYDIDDLPSLTTYIYIRIELQRNRHTSDADRRLPFSVCFLPVAFQSAPHDGTSYFACICCTSLHLMPPSTTFVTI